MGGTASPGNGKAAPRADETQRDIRDAPSYQLAMLASLNDRKGQIEFADAFGVSLGEWRALANIFILAPVSLAELARRMMLDKGQLSRTVRKLVQRRWVASRAAPANRRAVLLTLTTAGRARHAALLRFAIARNERTMSVLTAAERQHFSTCLSKLRAHVEAEFAALSENAARTPVARSARPEQHESSRFGVRSNAK